MVCQGPVPCQAPGTPCGGKIPNVELYLGKYFRIVLFWVEDDTALLVFMIFFVVLNKLAMAEGSTKRKGWCCSVLSGGVQHHAG